MSGWVRILLRDPQVWIAGTFETITWTTPTGQQRERRSYLSAYPEEPELYLARGVLVDPDSGEFLRDATNQPVLLEWSMLVNGGNIAYLEFLER